ncbi:putative recombination hotspot-binding protein [Venturia nashicola]|uniref:Putative recombination hotspot-binding protein n=1 Tax=Venturia nashicola TaxID=86259 RepID=A0A4Z1P4Q5_9PEZI|nr:putative recombination hotspot-binding protein [Venturia nashicola]
MSEPTRGRGRGKKVVAPRGKGRRTVEERAKISEQEAQRRKGEQERYEREQARLARDAARKARESNRGRTRGRGGFMGESRAPMPAGPFSAGSVISGDIGRGKAFPRPWAPSSVTAGGSGNIRNVPASIKHVKFEHGVRPKTEGGDLMDLDAVREVQDGGYISSDPDEIEEGKRRDIDQIDLLSDDETAGEPGETGVSGEASKKERIHMHPIRLHRHEHRDRAPPIKPDSDVPVKKEIIDEDGATGTPISSVRKGKQPAKDVEITGSSTPFHGVYRDEPAQTEPTIKEEPMDDAEEELPASAILEENIGPKDNPDIKPKRTHKLGPKHSQPVLNTVEDHAEYERYQQDLLSLTHELAHTTVNDAGGIVEDHKIDRTYLFQFPPVVPDLVPQKPIFVKDEEPIEEPTSTAPTETTISIPGAPQPPPAPTIKIEDDEKERSNRPPHLPKLASGLVGKLQVHKSGKVTLNWGGASLELHKGIDTTFLQDIVLVKRDEDAPVAAVAKGAIGGEAMAFGQVRGKFVVTPDWDRVLG